MLTSTALSTDIVQIATNKRQSLMEDYEETVRQRNAVELQKWEERVSRQQSELKKKQHADRLRQLQVMPYMLVSIFQYMVFIENCQSVWWEWAHNVCSSEDCRGVTQETGSGSF